VQALAFSADNQYLVSAGDSDAVIIWCCTTGCCIQKLDVSIQYCTEILLNTMNYTFVNSIYRYGIVEFNVTLDTLEVILGTILRVA